MANIHLQVKTYIILLVLISVTTFSQNDRVAFKIIAKSKMVTAIYDFDIEGKPLKNVLKNSDDKIWYNAEFYYRTGLLDSIYKKLYFLKQNPEESWVLFTYDKNKNLLSQTTYKKQSEILEDETAIFIYGENQTLDTIKKLNEHNWFRKYDSDNRIIEETSVYAYIEKPDSYDTKYFTYFDNKTIEKYKYQSTLNIIESSTTYEFIEGKLMKELTSGGRLTEYKYSSDGLLKQSISAEAISDYEVVLKKADLKNHIIKKINKILLSDYSDINWYR